MHASKYCRPSGRARIFRCAGAKSWYHRRMRTLIVLCAIATGCGTESGNNSTNNTTTPTNTTPTPTPPATTGDACAEIGPRFVDLVRAMPRGCQIDADCKIAPRAQVCDCDLAVTEATDLGDYDAVRAEMDAAQCANPFGCGDTTCPYRRLSDPGELYPRCNADKECEIVQVMTCERYEAAATGGIVSPGSCQDDDGCTILSHLNPCGCPESITKNFPALTHETIAEVIAINDARCELTCDECPATGTPTCEANSCTM